VGVEYFASIYLPDRWPLIFGAALVVMIMFMYSRWSVGIVKLWRKLFRGTAA
jgi:hypothetical protein